LTMLGGKFTNIALRQLRELHPFLIYLPRDCKSETVGAALDRIIDVPSFSDLAMLVEEDPWHTRSSTLPRRLTT
jgi:hypothetical protein